jgi:hypothetical protein
MSKFIAIVALLLSAICFAASLHMERAIWGASVTLPLPPKGYSVASTFQLNSPGQFKIEVQVPSLSTGNISMRDKPALAVNLDVRLERSGGKPIEIQPTLHHGGEIGFSKLDLYFSDPISLPSGEYVLRATTLSASPSAPQSALLTLNPVLDQSGRIIAIDLLRIIGWIFLFVGVVVAVFGSWPNNSFKPTPHRGVGHVPTLR